ncbi:TPA: hypothetical protein DEF17_04555 [bacterium]|nr:MAG: hypothetical protein AUJ18_00435 [Candidatus Hydrogenedentes bacterium CG1_02_42_14]PIU47915.1 MAG: hypothetical protein COS94_04895 [Candidatus Hydrogenedentes bacterium CG07_land_8_20_14_0_80_42_17]HBW47186.1 hypothetical protein [bacterium]
MLKLSLFAFFAAMALGFALVVVLAKRVFRAAFGLMGTLCGIAGLMVLYGNTTVAALQVLIYVGGVFVLFLFSILVTENIEQAFFRRNKSSLIMSGVLSIAVAGILLIASATPFFLDPIWSYSMTNISAKEIGFSLLTTNLLAFEVISILLLAALIASIILIRKELKS